MLPLRVLAYERSVQYLQRSSDQIFPPSLLKSVNVTGIHDSHESVHALAYDKKGKNCSFHLLGNIEDVS